MNTYSFIKPVESLQPINQQLYTKDLKKVIQDQILPLCNNNNGTSSSFQLISQSDQQNAKLEMIQSSNDSVNTYRVTGELYRTSIEQVFDLLWKLENSIPLSGSLEQCDLLNEFVVNFGGQLLTGCDSDQSCVIQLLYHAHKSPGFMISARDFLLIRTNVDLVLSNGQKAKCIASTSVTHGMAGERPKFVRGSLHFSGYILKQSEDKPGTVEVTYVIKSDPRGSLPSWVLSMANKTLISKFVELQAHIDRMN